MPARSTCCSSRQTHKGGEWGAALLEHVAQDQPELRLDVNEQNPAAVAFYTAKGFTQVGRSEVDGQGRPFPLLHLARNAS